MSGLIFGLALLLALTAVFGLRRPRAIGSRPRAIERAPAVTPALPAPASLPGGAPSRAILVDSPRVIDSYAERWPCPVCASAVRCEPHQVRHVGGERYRVSQPRCPQCGFTREVYFLLRSCAAD